MDAQDPHSSPLTDFDFELRAYQERLRAATGIGPGDHVLDIGCGAGQSTRDAARAAAPGRVTGIDVSEPALERTRRVAIAEHLDNVTFEHGNVQAHPFAPGHYDVAISRFGVMFFSDPPAAFGNIARALRVDARVVFLVWQSHERNEWATAIAAALSGQPRPAKAADAFSLGDRAETTRVLEGAGFGDVRFSEVREPVYYGRDIDAAMEWVRGFTRDTLARLSPEDAARAVERLRATIAAHDAGDEGVVFDSRAWLVTARRR